MPFPSVHDAVAGAPAEPELFLGGKRVIFRHLYAMEILNIHFLSPIYYFTFKNNFMAESFLCFQNHFYLKFLVSKHNVGGYT